MFKKNRVGISQLMDKVGLIIALFAIILIFSLMNKNFFSLQNILNVLVASSLIGLVAIGETFLIISGSVDLSAGSVAAFASVLSAFLLANGVHVAIAIPLVLIAGGIIGLFNGLVVTKLKIESFIATLGTMSIVRGFAFILCKGKPIMINDKILIAIGNYRIFDTVTIPVLLLVACFIVFAIILNKTRFGRSTYVLGGNKYAARLAGLNSTKITNKIFMMTAMFASLGGVLLAGRMNSGNPAASEGLEFDAVTAAVLGGTAFTGGVGNMLGTILGVIILQAFNTGLIMINVPTFWQRVAKGLLLLVALAFDFYRKSMREKKQLLNN